MSFQVTKGIHFFRLQAEIPKDGNPYEMIVQLCARESLYEANEDGSPNYQKLVGQTSEQAILTLPNLSEMEIKYPGIVDAIRLIQFASVSEGLIIMESRLNPPASEPVPEPESVA